MTLYPAPMAATIGLPVLAKAKHPDWLPADLTQICSMQITTNSRLLSGEARMGGILPSPIQPITKEWMILPQKIPAMYSTHSEEQPILFPTPILLI